MGCFAAVDGIPYEKALAGFLRKEDVFELSAKTKPDFSL